MWPFSKKEKPVVVALPRMTLKDYIGYPEAIRNSYDVRHGRILSGEGKVLLEKRGIKTKKEYINWG